MTTVSSGGFWHKGQLKVEEIVRICVYVSSPNSLAWLKLAHVTFVYYFEFNRENVELVNRQDLLLTLLGTVPPGSPSTSSETLPSWVQFPPRLPWQRMDWLSATIL